MTSANRILILLALLILTNDVKSQNNNAGFKLVFTKGNHAEFWALGMNSIYILTDTSLTFRRQRQDPKSDSVIMIQASSKYILDQIKSIKWYDLKEYYFNECVMTTSGDEYYLSVTSDSVVKKINLHYYYLEEFDQLTNCLNKLLPDNYKIYYLTSDTKQDCNY